MVRMPNRLELDVPKFVASYPILRGPIPINWNGLEATIIIEGYSFASMEGFLDTWTAKI